MLFADKVLTFYRSLEINEKLPRGINVLNPYREQLTFSLCEKFYKKYYNDNEDRIMIMGINPGRFGAGLTGIPFTDPVKLENICEIDNPLPKKTELSADFIHAMISAYGGTQPFFKKFYFNSASPLGFTLEGKNLNYYDKPELVKALSRFIRQSIETQLKFGINTDVVFCLGEGENFRYLSRLNDEKKYFKKIIPLAHPRFIMQYKRKMTDQYIRAYLQVLKGER